MATAVPGRVRAGVLAVSRLLSWLPGSGLAVLVGLALIWLGGAVHTANPSTVSAQAQAQPVRLVAQVRPSAGAGVIVPSNADGSSGSSGSSSCGDASGAPCGGSFMLGRASAGSGMTATTTTTAEQTSNDSRGPGLIEWVLSLLGSSDGSSSGSAVSLDSEQSGHGAAMVNRML
ncbi:MAG TPA: hypothetical protein VGH89_31905, partial [Pseudonocardia sp.]